MQSESGALDPDFRPQFLTVGERRVAFLQRAGNRSEGGRPGLVWLGGFMSNMRSTKPNFLDQYAAAHGRAFLRFDYSGHGESEGEFEAGTIGAWLEEALAIFRVAPPGPQILVGSSMGGWLALLCARALAENGESARLAGLVLIAPAVDMTERLIFQRLSAKSRTTLEAEGRCILPSAYADSPYVVTRRLIEEGRNHLMLDAVIRSYCPVHILQGMQDADVPWQHAMLLVERLAGDPVVLTLVKDGDHRLSRPSDLALTAQAIETIAPS
ncbi:MAG TPA: alpha/beta hydrolase [Methylovirgula sp.]|nr:alpha/beta hydrolase [Methylovirgula sp.]